MNQRPLFGLAFALALPCSLFATEFSVEQVDDGIVIKIDGELFTKYITQGEGDKPYFWPVLGPNGERMTRAYPIENVPGEKQDHPHHRSMWFGQQDINGFDTWHEKLSFEERFRNKPEELEKRMATLGSTRHDEVVRAEAVGDRAFLETSSTYLNHEGKPMLEDKRKFVFHVDADTGSRIIDVELTFLGTQDKVSLGDAKDAGFSLRVAHSMCVEAEQGGRIANSEGDEDKEAWSKPAKWCDFNGPVEGKTVGIAMLNHPSSFRYPNPWHVRTYGLFTANPFGLKSLNQSKDDGAVVLNKGETLTLRYRVLLHDGDEKAAKIAEAFEAYAAEDF